MGRSRRQQVIRFFVLWDLLVVVITLVANGLLSDECLDLLLLLHDNRPVVIDDVNPFGEMDPALFPRNVQISSEKVPMNRRYIP